MLNIILAESALETIPKILWSHNAIRNHAKRKRKRPKLLLLDRSYHHAAMKKLSESEKRGRPDIVHFALLEALGSPLNKEKLLKIYVHTIANYIIRLNSKVRLPRNYDRFVGLLEQLFQLGEISSKKQKLLVLEHKNLAEVFVETKTDYVVVFSRMGTPQTIEDVVSKLLKKDSPTVIIGGFPHGQFSKSIIESADEVVSIDREMLEAWILVSRVIYEYERGISLPHKRVH